MIIHIIILLCYEFTILVTHGRYGFIFEIMYNIITKYSYNVVISMSIIIMEETLWTRDFRIPYF